MEVDFTVVGGGSAGYAAARTAVSLGLSTVVVEGGEKVGGLCILRGCMPSKALIESANRFRTMRRAKDFGLRAEGIGANGGEIIARKRRLIGEFADYRQQQLEVGGFTFLRGNAKFLSKSEIEVRLLSGGTEQIRTRTAVISTGSVTSMPPVPGLAESGALTSDEVLELEDLPESIVILGGGAIALEMAHYFEALGTETTLIQRSAHILKGDDEEAACVIEEAFRERGIKVFTGTKIESIRRNNGAVDVVFEHEGQEMKVCAAAILNALGRSPNTGGLGLDAAGVELDCGRVVASSAQQTSSPCIFAAGDVCGPIEVVHIAIQQGEIAARNASRLIRGEGPMEKIDYRLKLFGIFSEPQFASVGLNEIECREQGIPFLSAKYPFVDHGKSQVIGETEGFVKLLADPSSGVLLGGSCVGPHASDLIHEVVVAMHFHATAADLAAIPHYHPTLSEIWTYPAEELASQVLRQNNSSADPRGS